jgi:lactate dehydrogenase-like 2-hydroxyacid dehydrogenase
MASERTEVLMLAPKPQIAVGLEEAFTVLRAWEAPDKDKFIADVAPRVRAIATPGHWAPVRSDMMARFPKLEIVSSFGVGYDHVDARWAGERGIVVTNTPEVLTEEVADTATGLLLATVRQFPQAERYLRAGNWPKSGDYPLCKSTLRNRTVGIVGLGRIGKAIARRLEAMQVPVVYHGRNKQEGVPYRYYAKVLDMARDVDVLLLVAPGGAETRHIVNAEVLKALGSDGILINVGRGSLVDEDALIAALKDGTIMTAGLDVYAKEPQVPAELIAMDHVVLWPHLGSSTEHTRRAMDMLVVDNLKAWGQGKPPLTPVAETPWPPRKQAQAS